MSSAVLAIVSTALLSCAGCQAIFGIGDTTLAGDGGVGVENDAASFSIQITPGNVRIVRGQTSVLTVSATNATGEVSVTIENLPAGVTQAPLPLMLEPPTFTNTVILMASTTAILGDSTSTLHSVVGGSGVFNQPLALVVTEGAGSFDSTFGTDGVAVVGGQAFAGVIVQSDGKIVVGGMAIVGQPQQSTWDLARVDTSGNLDPSFGPSGSTGIITGASTDDFIISGLAAQSDGSILAVGTLAKNQLAVMRFDENGNVDMSFGASGRTAAPAALGTTFGTAVVEQPNSLGIVAVGRTSENIGAICRFLPGGTLYTTFGDGTGGGCVVEGAENTELAAAIALADDSVVAAGEDVVWRIHGNGVSDGSFGVGGMTAVTGLNPITMVRQSDGSLVLPECCDSVGLERVDSLGNPDHGFGLSNPDPELDGWIPALAVNPDNDSLVVAMTGYNDDDELNAIFFRTDKNGLLDQKFGASGLVKVQPTDTTWTINAMAIEPDGRIVVVGFEEGLGAVILRLWQ